MITSFFILYNYYNIDFIICQGVFQKILKKFRWSDWWDNLTLSAQHFSTLYADPSAGVYFIPLTLLIIAGFQENASGNIAQRNRL